MQDNTFILDKYYNIVNEISDYNNYDENIRHLLYIIMPSFVVKYGASYEKLIIDCFKDTFVFVKDDNTSDNIEAFFDRKLFNYGEKILSKKYIVINGLNKNEYIKLIDSVAHEFNHAINSYKNEIVVNGEVMLLRTGLSYLIYSNSSFSKSNSYILEEIVNTKQSEEIISIIYNLNYNGNNSEIKNLLDILKKEKKENNFTSDAYGFYMDCCRDLLSNKTFIKNIELYRINGDVSEINLFFDDIYGEKGTYDELNKLLFDTEIQLQKYDKNVFTYIIRKRIERNVHKIRRIVKSFCDATVYK